MFTPTLEGIRGQPLDETAVIAVLTSGAGCSQRADRAPEPNRFEPPTRQSTARRFSWLGLSRAQFPPQAALLVPVEHGGQRPRLPQMQRAATPLGAAEEQDLFLDVRRQLQEAHNLGDARPADVSEPGQRGIVLDRPLAGASQSDAPAPVGVPGAGCARVAAAARRRAGVPCVRPGRGDGSGRYTR
jgi:hypothetical protein